MHRILQVNEINYVKINGTWQPYAIGSINQIWKKMWWFLFLLLLLLNTNFQQSQFFNSVKEEHKTENKYCIQTVVLCFHLNTILTCLSFRMNWVEISIINKLIANFIRYNMSNCVMWEHKKYHVYRFLNECLLVPIQCERWFNMKNRSFFFFGLDRDWVNGNWLTIIVITI